MRSVELRRQHDAGHEGENSAGGVEDDQEYGDSDGLDEDGGDAVEPDDPAKGRDEHGVVDGGVSLGLSGEHVADEGCDDQDEDELHRAHDQLKDIHRGGFGDSARCSLSMVAIMNWSRCSSSTSFEGSSVVKRQDKRRGEKTK